MPKIITILEKRSTACRKIFAMVGTITKPRDHPWGHEKPSINNAKMDISYWTMNKLGLTNRCWNADLLWGIRLLKKTAPPYGTSQSTTSSFMFTPKTRQLHTVYENICKQILPSASWSMLLSILFRSGPVAYSCCHLNNYILMHLALVLVNGNVSWKLNVNGRLIVYL